MGQVPPLQCKNIYRYRPRVMSNERVIRLVESAIEWEEGPRSSQIRYADILHVRLGYRPGNLANNRFIAEIWAKDGTKLEIASISARTMFDSQNLGSQFRIFIAELHRRIAKVSTSCRFEGGLPSWRWWPAVFVAVVTIAAAFYLISRALFMGELIFTALLICLSAFLMWQMGGIVLRNRPREYSPLAIPAILLP